MLIDLKFLGDKLPFAALDLHPIFEVIPYRTMVAPYLHRRVLVELWYCDVSLLLSPVQKLVTAMAAFDCRVTGVDIS